MPSEAKVESAEVSESDGKEAEAKSESSEAKSESSESVDWPKLRRSVLRASERTLPGFEESSASRKWHAPFYFVQAADTQLGLIDHYGDGKVGSHYPNVGWEKELESGVKRERRQTPPLNFFGSNYMYIRFFT